MTQIGLKISHSFWICAESKILNFFRVKHAKTDSLIPTIFCNENKISYVLHFKGRTVNFLLMIQGTLFTSSVHSNHKTTVSKNC